MRGIISILLILFSLGALAQESSIKDDAKALVLLTFDTSQMKQMKFSIATTVEKEQKEAFKNEMDVAINAFVEECSKFYIANYTHEEIKELVKFFETPVGKKMAKDHRKLLEGSFPMGKEWDMQIYQLKKKEDNKENKE